jgi:hypothetical protein
MRDVHNHLIDDLGLAICLGVEGGGFSELGVGKGVYNPCFLMDSLAMA